MARRFQQPVHNGLSEAFRGKSLGIDLRHTFIIEFSQNGVQMSGISNITITLIIGGGALLDDTDYTLNSNMLSLPTTLINLSYRMITCKKNVILYGLSSSYELNNKEFIRKLNYISSNANYFSLRDTNSLKILNKCGINTNK